MILYRIYLKLLITKINFMWWFVKHFMPKTHERWEEEFQEQSAEDFLADYNNEIFWQRENGR
jgi:hypothetical protein